MSNLLTDKLQFSKCPRTVVLILWVVNLLDRMTHSQGTQNIQKSTMSSELTALSFFELLIKWFFLMSSREKPMARFSSDCLGP